MERSRLRELDSAYRAVGGRIGSLPDFRMRDLLPSRRLFEPDSLRSRSPRPRRLEVYALVAGVPFPARFAARLTRVQRDVSRILGRRLRYWVRPANLGVEFAVFKWPGDPALGAGRVDQIKAALARVEQRPFVLEIRGVQVHPDGCVVAKGFDRPGSVFGARRELRALLPWLPARQSGWAHVPLGRILEPLGADRFARLRAYMEIHRRAPVAACRVDAMRLVHETRWYMERKEILAEYALA